MKLWRAFKRKLCQCPISGYSHFYPALLEPAVLATFRARFCRYFSEYSDNSLKMRKNRAEGKLYFSKYIFLCACPHYSWNSQAKQDRPALIKVHRQFNITMISFCPSMFCSVNYNFTGEAICLRHHCFSYLRCFVPAAAFAGQYFGRDESEGQSLWLKHNEPPGLRRIRYQAFLI